MVRVVILIALAAAVTLVHAEAWRGEAFEAAEALFRQDPRWLGTDGADSTPLLDGRIYWTFEDTLIATTDAHSRTESVFARNSIAIQTGQNPLTANMEFFWNTDAQGAPTAFFPDDGPAWHWTGGALHLAEGPLLTFLMRIVETPGKDLGFANDGFALAITDNPLDPPPQWRTRIVRGPVITHAAPATDVVRDGDWVVGLALRQEGQHAAALVRYQATALVAGNLSGPEWWDGSAWVREIALGPAGPAWVIDDSGNEATLHFDAPSRRWVHVASQGFGAARIVMRSAPALTGPWSAPQVVYDPPENRDPGSTVYSALAHPELAAPGAGELLVTYATNAIDFEDLFRPPGTQALYWPRVVRLRLTPE